LIRFQQIGRTARSCKFGRLWQPTWARNYASSSTTFPLNGKKRHDACRPQRTSPRTDQVGRKEET